MALAQPPGCRSCRTPEGEPGEGGEWAHAAASVGGRGSLLNDIDRELQPLADSDRRVLLWELGQKLRRAEQGDLVYGEESCYDVCQCRRQHGQILEIRLSDVSTCEASEDPDEPLARHCRLYFTERSSHPRELLSLSFRLKFPGKIGLEEQDGHIDEAVGRLFRHEALSR